MYSQIKSSIYGRSKPLLWYLKQPIYFSYSEKLQRNPFLKYLYIISQYTSDSIIHCNTPQTQHVDPHIFSGEWKRHKFLIRSFHQTPKIYDKKTRSMPRLLYMQNPLRWLTNKLDFGMLKRAWDPQFDESEFRRGTKQAVSTITKFVSSNMFANLKGLLTRPALVGLQQDVETKWSDEQRRLIALEPEDIQLAIPRKVHFQRIVAQKFCDVDMVFIAMKWIEHGGSSAIIFVEVISRFHREYTEGLLPDWTVSLFLVTQFNILPR